MKSRKTERSFRPISILLGAAPALATAGFLMACSGAYPAIDDDPLVTSDDPYRLVVLPPATQVPSGSERSDSSSDGGVAPDAAKTTDGGGSFDAAVDRQATGCVEPEPNENPATAPMLPLNFTCGRLSDGADVDYFVRTTAAGEQAFRVVSPAGPAGDALMVTIQATGGSTITLGRDDTVVLPVGVKCSFQVRSITATPTSYGILVER